MVQTCDVIVLGSGASGLVAAVAAHHHGADVCVFEKSGLLGGTSAISGGIVWMPNNHHMADAGLADSRGDALDYLSSLSLGHIDSDLAATFVDEGPAAIKWLEEHTPCRFAIVDGYPDYHPEHPGGKPGGGRSLDNELFDWTSLGEWGDRIRTDSPRPLTLRETPLGGATALPAMSVIGERIAAGSVGFGGALVGALVRSCLERGIDLQTEHRAEALLTADDGRVTGVRFSTPTGPVEVNARRGVILATGGFEWNDDLVKTHLRGPMVLAASPATNTGDGLTMAMDAGARLGNMSGAWWVPVTQVPGDQRWGVQRAHLILGERTRPGSIMVNGSGRRFCNEAANYNALGGVFHAFDPVSFSYPNQPAWMIFDHQHKQRYDVASAKAGDTTPDWIVSAPTVRELGEALGIDADMLTTTVDRFNISAVNGADPDFGRGQSAYDTFNGDRSFEGVAATLGPLERGPYHAIRIDIGSLGTNGGPRTDSRSRVLSRHGGVIAGLYAVGNAMAAPTGMVYGGAGGTLGPAITFGFIAGRDAAES